MYLIYGRGTLSDHVSAVETSFFDQEGRKT